VLQHQLHEARGQLEPMDTEMTTMKETIEELNKEYTSGMKAAAVLERKTKTSNHKQTILQKELIKGSNKITKLKSTILKFSRDVESIVTQPGSNHAKWAEGLLDLYKTYVSHVCSCFFDAPCV
jgi:chromosome segregation ATPase|tara:strand:+ start:3494 stop:3862 length:369 start_codon:yes stop_codon:yes gene_type:complete